MKLPVPSTNGLRTLAHHLDGWSGRDGDRLQIARTVAAMARAVVEIRDLLSLGALAGPFGARTGKWGDVDPQRELDVLANTKVIAALRDAPVATLVSEELDEPLSLSPTGHLIVAVDPLDGASNADTNAAIGTIFSVLPETGEGAKVALGTGTRQHAAGFAVYGPQTVFVLTLGQGTDVFTLDPASATFKLTSAGVQIPVQAAEFAINAANHFHWDETIRSYVDNCLRAEEAPPAVSYNMRWTGSFVAEIFRILVRGGIYLYPGDARPAFRDGRLRLAYEASPVAFIVEQAGGAASTGRQRILDVPVHAWHQRTPVIIGSRNEVAHVDRLYGEPFLAAERSPLFNRRGLFRV
jgi:fructose-1,6-bisphosphatase I